MTDLSIRLLGPFQVEAAGEPITSFASDRVRALLAYLATEADQPHRRDKLAGLLWPNSPQKTARTNLRRALSYCRKAIGDHHANPPYLLITRQTIQFNSAGDAWVDVAAFTAVSNSPGGLRDRLDSTSTNLREDEALEAAAVLYRGHFLEGFYVDGSLPFEEWALLKGERFQRQALLLLHRLVAHYEARGAYERAVPHAWRQVELDPFQEPAQRQVIRWIVFGGSRWALCRASWVWMLLLESLQLFLLSVVQFLAFQIAIASAYDDRIVALKVQHRPADCFLKSRVFPLQQTQQQVDLVVAVGSPEPTGEPVKVARR
ncbi:MAG: BTAD domain-containing putative transcriptional regulator [Anaerolineae bacterium]